MPNIDSEHILDLLALSMVSGLGPVRVGRLLDRFTTASGVFEASPAEIERVEGIGPKTARAIGRERKKALGRAREEMRQAEEIGATVLCRDDPRFPGLLRPLPGCPHVLFVRGGFDDRDRFAVGIVGSRRCTGYGLEQATRFAGAFASAGITVVSGGARGIDSAAHRGALNVGGRTIVVLGCGLGHCYPPENLAMFDHIVESGGAVVSELPCDTPPAPENFPARNRLISGLSLGVLVVEAGLKSGALITAGVAAEEHGRDVFALPGRVDSAASEGVHGLIKSGGALLVTEPADIIGALEAPAWHLFQGTHESRYTLGGGVSPGTAGGGLEDRPVPGGEAGRAVLVACTEPSTPDQIGLATGLDASAVRQAVTLLEIGGFLKRSGSKLVRSR
ncbi:MAG TPA: DNA-protecting protein DprA [Phycisphaerales bacterium]|nr:DNA-protecting protein DprA [Phycisphaerales bacterium]